MFRLKLISLLALVWLVACNDKPSSPGTPPSGLTVVPGTFQITVLEPAQDGNSLAQAAVVSGHCGKPQYPITVVGNSQTIYAVCQNDYTWSAPVSGKNAAEGSLSFQITLRDLNLTGGSSTVTRVFNRVDGICQLASAQTKTFANFGDAGVDGASVPYKICNSQQFSNIRYYLGKNFQLAQDIDFAQSIFPTIIGPFTGTLDGRGFLLRDFTAQDVNGTGTAVGIFKVAQGATVKNLKIMNGRVEGNMRLGMIAGDWKGTGLIDNVTVTGNVVATSSIAGGLVGLATATANLTIRNAKVQVTVSGLDYVGGGLGVINSNDGSLTIENSQFLTTVSGQSMVGGVIGNVGEDQTNLTNVTHTGVITATSSSVGGVIGSAIGGTYTNIRHVGNINSSKAAGDGFIGGLFGQTTGSSTILGSSSVANIVAGSKFVGGLAGRFHSGSISGSYSRGSIAVNDTSSTTSLMSGVGGIAGSTSLDAAFSQSYSQSNISGRINSVGGIIGLMNGTASSINECYSTGTINAKSSLVGGIVGDFKGQSITNSYSQANINVDQPAASAFVGGIVGSAQSTGGQYTRLYYSGVLTITNGAADVVGGIVAYLKNGTLSEAYMSGTVQGARTRVGGVAGHSVDSTIKNSLMTGTVTATGTTVAGIAGAVTGGFVNDVFASGTVQANGVLGGLVGWLAAPANFQRGYFAGKIYKNASSTEVDTYIGRVMGYKESATTYGSLFGYDQSLVKRLSDNGTIAHNNLGVLSTQAQLKSSASYTNFVFTDNASLFDWDMPAANFKLPLQATVYEFAIPDWLGTTGYGFTSPTVWADDPLSAPVSTLLETYGGTLASYSQDQFDAVTATSTATSITAGQLQVSVLDPAVNGLPIATKRLVSGECGVPGGVIKLTGSFVLNTICQSNYRWAAIIDATNEAVGTLTLTAQLFSLDTLTTSTSVSRTLVKENGICSDPTVLRKLYANYGSGGNGTSVPYTICSVTQLRNIIYNPAAKFELANDIDFGSMLMDPVAGTFKGTFDGKNFKLRNFTISKPGNANIGLFANADGATIKNLTLDALNVTGYVNVGLLVGTWKGAGTIQNISLTNSRLKAIGLAGGLVGAGTTASALTISSITTDNLIVEGNNQTGALVGGITTTDGSFSLSNSTVKATVTGLTYVGGVVGEILQPNATVSNVSFIGNVTAQKTHLGGIVGHAASGSFSNLSVTGNISTVWKDVDVFVGGVIGLLDSTAIMTALTYSGNINAAGNYVGGLIGRLNVGTLSNSTSSGTLTVSSPTVGSIRNRVGGIVGGIGQTVTAPAVSAPSTLDNVISTMSINAQANQVGGLVGEFGGPDSILKNSRFTGASILGRNSLIGGAVGFFHGVQMLDTYSTGAVAITAPTPNAYVGGLIGYSNSKFADHQRLWASGNVTANDGTADYFGGLIGYFRAGTLSDSYATGNISGARLVNGGLVGMARGVIRRSFATGNVSASLRHNGGLVGYLNIGVPIDSAAPTVLTIDPLIEDCYSSGNVTASGTAVTDVSGGLVGYVNTTGLTGRVKNSYTRSAVAKASGSTLPAAALGSVFGGAFAANMVDNTSLYYLVTNLPAGGTANGTSMTAGQMISPANYVGLNFASTPGWRMPLASTQVPGFGQNFLWPTLSWVGAGTTFEQHKVKGTIAGLQHSTLKLQLNSGEEITINPGTTNFTFTTLIDSGSPYTVALTAQPTAPAITCTISNASGTMGSADVTNVAVNCPTVNTIAINAAATTITVGSSQALTVSGTLSNSVVIDLTAYTALSVSGTSFTLTGTNLNAVSGGAGTVTATYLTKTATKNFTAFAPPQPPTALAWQGTSPSATNVIYAQWTLSPSVGIASQKIDYYSNGTCSGGIASTKTLTASAVADTFTGVDATTYSFKVTAIDGASAQAVSGCSNAMTITLPTPSPVSNVSVASVWASGALPITSPLYSWTNPASGITGVMAALGTTSGGADLVGWGNIGNVASYNYVNVAGLTACALVYPSFKTVNSFGKQSSVVTGPTFRWDNSAPSVPGTPAMTGVASSTTSQVATWTASSDNCQFSQYQIAIGTTAGGIDIISWFSVGNVTTYQAIDGSGGLNFNLVEGQNYYFSVRGRDAAGNYSPVATSAAWQLPSTGLAKTLWFDASQQNDIRDRTNLTPADPGFTNKVATWYDRGTSGVYDAVSPAATNDAGYNSTVTHVTFNGTNQYLTIPGGASFDNTTVTTKNMFVSFKTSTDTTSRQVIFEQGTSARGMNMYILSGQLYCAFWQTTNGGDGAQAILYVQNAVSPNTTYHVAAVLDYSNYTTATGPNGAFKCFLNGAQWGATMSTTSRMYAQTGSNGLGAAYTGTRFHDTTTTTTGNYFAGHILEAFQLTAAPSDTTVTSVQNALMSKWTSGELSSPGNLSLTNNSTQTKAPRASWQPIVSNYFVTHHYEMAIGTTQGGSEVLYWSNIGNVTTYEAQNGVDGLSINLSYGVNYYLSVKAVDAFGNESLSADSAAWQVYPSASLQLASTFLKLDASARNTIKDGSNIDAATGGFAGVVATWVNAITAGTNDFTQTTAANRPAYVAAADAVRFDQTNDSMSSASDANQTNSIFTQKAITVVFTTGPDVTTRQFIYEQGSRNNRGMMIYIEAGQLYCLFHNSKNGGDGAQAPLYQTTAVSAAQSYVVTLYLDYRNYTTTTGPNGTTGCYVNGVSQGTGSTTSRLYADTDPVYIGMRSSTTWHNSNSNGAGDYFGGDILEVQVTNTVPSSAQTYIDLQNALMNKWQ